MLYESSGRACAGRAYGTSSPAHWLNVRAAAMSAFAAEPDHFLEWARAADPATRPDAFLPRRRYAEYLGAILDATRRSCGDRLEVCADEIRDVDSVGGALQIHLRSGPTRTVSHLVLATGHPLPSPPIALAPKVVESGRFRDDPWNPAALDGLPRESRLLLLGSGLTAVDVLLEARRSGLRGTIHVLSRRGLLPLPHATVPAPGRALTGELAVDAKPRVLMRRMRDEARAACANGGDWRQVVDGIRGETSARWGSWSRAEKKRFLRHARPYWEVHRHRVAPEVGAQVAEEIGSGSAVLHPARVVRIDAAPSGLDVEIRPRGRSGTERLIVDRVINCTGPNTGVSMCDSELTRALLRRGLAVADDLGIGLHCDPDGALLGDTRAKGRLFTLGPLRKGELWESTAVPEIRVQAERVARRIVEDLDP